MSTFVDLKLVSSNDELLIKLQCTGYVLTKLLFEFVRSLKDFNRHGL